jgi:hypothetical protein
METVCSTHGGEDVSEESASVLKIEEAVPSKGIATCETRRCLNQKDYSITVALLINNYVFEAPISTYRLLIERSRVAHAQLYLSCFHLGLMTIGD